MLGPKTHEISKWIPGELSQDPLCSQRRPKKTQNQQLQPEERKASYPGQTAKQLSCREDADGRCEEDDEKESTEDQERGAKNALLSEPIDEPSVDEDTEESTNSRSIAKPSLPCRCELVVVRLGQ